MNPNSPGELKSTDNQGSILVGMRATNLLFYLIAMVLLINILDERWWVELILFFGLFSFRRILWSTRRYLLKDLRYVNYRRYLGLKRLLRTGMLVTYPAILVLGLWITGSVSAFWDVVIDFGLLNAMVHFYFYHKKNIGDHSRLIDKQVVSKAIGRWKSFIKNILPKRVRITSFRQKYYVPVKDIVYIESRGRKKIIVLSKPVKGSVDDDEKFVLRLNTGFAELKKIFEGAVTQVHKRFAVGPGVHTPNIANATPPIFSTRSMINWEQENRIVNELASIDAGLRLLELIPKGNFDC